MTKTLLLFHSVSGTHDEHECGVGCAVRADRGKESGDLPIPCSRVLRGRVRADGRMQGGRWVAGGQGGKGKDNEEDYRAQLNYRKVKCVEIEETSPWLSSSAGITHWAIKTVLVLHNDEAACSEAAVLVPPLQRAGETPTTCYACALRCNHGE